MSTPKKEVTKKPEPKAEPKITSATRKPAKPNMKHCIVV